MASARTPDALEHLQTQHDVLRKLLADARAKAAADVPGDAPAALPSSDYALREVLPELRRWLTRCSRQECTVFYPALENAGGDEAAVGYARAEHEVHCRLLERAEQLAEADPEVDGGDASDGHFRMTFDELTDRLLRHLEMVERALFPLARRLDIDLPALGRHMREQSAEEDAPAAERDEAGRLDIGAGEDRSPEL
jgi:hypothetical protein